ncbi:MAG: hypothetical protein H7144_09830 [Burkholderiales bacterium]|nr:hypothetical protein [Phycisphaerae bacterium]
MKNTHSYRLCALALACSSAGVSQVLATTYNFTSVADTNQGTFTQFGYGPTINDQGQVAFIGMNGFNDKGVYTRHYNGGGLTTIDTMTGFGGYMSEPVINNVGTVVFAKQAGFASEIRKGSGGATTLIVRGGDFPAQPSNGFTFNGVLSPSINDNGVVAFGGTLFDENGPQEGGGGGGVFTGTGGALTHRYTNSAPFADINDAGQLSLTAHFTHPPEAPANQEQAILRVEPNGSSTKFARSVPYHAPNPPFSVLDVHPSINEAGNVMFHANLTNGSNRMYAYNGTALVEVARTTDYQPGNFNQIYGAPALSDNGVTAFFAESEGLRGVFTGGHAENDKVIRELDGLFGDLVDTVGFHNGVNAHGQIVFNYTLLNTGRTGIAVATPSTSQVVASGAGSSALVGDDVPGVAGAGALNASFDNVTSAGVFSADFFRPDDTEELAIRIGAQAAATANFDIESAGSQVWTLEFSGDFANDVDLVFHYDPDGLTPSAEAELLIQHFENGQWFTPLQTLNMTANTITLSANSFSPFVLSAGPLPEPGSAMILIGALAGLVRCRRARA